MARGVAAWQQRTPRPSGHQREVPHLPPQEGAALPIAFTAASPPDAAGHKQQRTPQGSTQSPVSVTGDHLLRSASRNAPHSAPRPRPGGGSVWQEGHDRAGRGRGRGDLRPARRAGDVRADASHERGLLGVRGEAGHRVGADGAVAWGTRHRPAEVRGVARARGVPCAVHIPVPGMGPPVGAERAEGACGPLRRAQLRRSRGGRGVRRPVYSTITGRGRSSCGATK